MVVAGVQAEHDVLASASVAGVLQGADAPHA